VLTLFHLVWCALLWMLYSPPLARDRVALIALIAGVVPRVYFATQLPIAWRYEAFGEVRLLAFWGLTALWFAYLIAQTAKRPWLETKLAFPMLVLATIECFTPLSKILDGVTLTLTGQLVFAVAQFLYLRNAAGREPAGPAWGRL
jgi:hypothetical protein